MIEEKRVQEDVQSDKYICLTKVWGVTYGNRQEIVQKCQLGQELELEITDSPDRMFGAYRAIAVYGVFDEDEGLKSRAQLGFLQSKIAEELMPNMQHGKKYQCFVEKVTGGSNNKEYFGLNIKIIGEPIEKYTEIKEDTEIKEYTEIKEDTEIPIIPNGIKQLTVLKDGKYQKMSPQEYYEYLGSVQDSIDAPVYFIKNHDELTATSIDEYNAYEKNMIMDYDYEYDNDYVDYSSEEDMW